MNFVIRPTLPPLNAYATPAFAFLRSPFNPFSYNPWALAWAALLEHLMTMPVSPIIALVSPPLGTPEVAFSPLPHVEFLAVNVVAGKAPTPLATPDASSATVKTKKALTPRSKKDMKEPTAWEVKSLAQVGTIVVKPIVAIRPALVARAVVVPASAPNTAPMPAPSTAVKALSFDDSTSGAPTAPKSNRAQRGGRSPKNVVRTLNGSTE